MLAIASPADVVEALSGELFLAQAGVPIRSKLSGKTVDAKELFIIMLETGLITDVNDPVTGRPFVIGANFTNRYSERGLVRKYGMDSDTVRFIQDDRRLNRHPVVLGGIGDPGFDAWRGAAKQWGDRNVSRILFYPSELLGAAVNTAAGGAYLINVEIALRDEMIAKAKAEGRKWSRQDEDALEQAMITWRQGIGDVVGIVQAAGIGITKLAARRAMKKAWAETAEETGEYVFKHEPARVFRAGENVYTGAPDELRDFAFSVLMDPSTYKLLDLGAVPRSVADRLTKLGVKNAHSMNFVLESHDLVHAFNRHSNIVSEARRGQRAIDLKDFDELLDALRNPDSITNAGVYYGVAHLRFEKRIRGNLITIQSVRPRRGNIGLKTMYIKQ